MKVNKLFRPTIFMALLVVMTVSCSNDEDERVSSIIGEWLCDESDNMHIYLSTVKFEENLKFSSWTASVSKNINETECRYGSYTYNTSSINIISSESNSSRQISQDWRVNKVDDYTIDIYDPSNNKQMVFHKLIDEYRMNVGDKIQFKFSDVNFEATKFMSCDNKIATVSSTGAITAIKRGTTYIRVLSPLGEVDVRVIVTDPNNVLDDYVKYIGKNYMNVISDFGRTSLEGQTERGYSVLKYDVLDDVIKMVDINYWPNNQVFRCIAQFQDDVDIAEIISSFNQKYKSISSKVPTSHLYTCSNEEENVRLMINEELRGVYYELIPNAFEQFDYYILLTIDQVLDILGLQYNFDELKYNTGYTFPLEGTDNIFDALIIEYDPNTLHVTNVRLKCNKLITKAEIEKWYDKHYFKSTNLSYFPYGNKPALVDCDYVVGVVEDNKGIYLWYTTDLRAKI